MIALLGIPARTAKVVGEYATRYRVREGIRRLTLDRPEALNVLDDDVPRRLASKSRSRR